MWPLLFFVFFNFCCLAGLANAEVISYFERIKSNQHALYSFFANMPKGGELHYHLMGGFYPEHLLELMGKDEYCFDLTTNTATKKILTCNGVDTYTHFNQTPFYDQIIRAWSLKDFIADHESAHDHFFATFDKFLVPFIDYSSILLAKTMARAAVMHELYLEIMIMPDSKPIPVLPLPPDGNYQAIKKKLLANNKFIANVNATRANGNELLVQARDYLGCQHSSKIPACALVVKFQYYVLRNQPLDSFFAQALHAFMVADHSKVYVGVNLVQPEDGYISMHDYHKHMAIFAFLHQAYPKVNIALHAGELTSNLVDIDNLRFHVNDAVKIAKAQRIGHGIDIAYETNADNLVDIMSNQSVAVEINLTSSKLILGVAGKAHPLNYYLAHHVPVVLSTDDEGILRTDLTSQYVQAVQDHHLDYLTIKQINRNALTFSFLPGLSIWANPLTGSLITACSHLTSKTCLQLIKTNPKARLQQQLELQLQAFERQF